MKDSLPANHFSLSLLMRPVQAGADPSTALAAMRRHLTAGETVYVYDDRQGTPEDPTWVINSVNEAEPVLNILRSLPRNS